MDDHSDLVDALRYIEPSGLDYAQWAEVGMALHESGLPLSVWEDWSRRDAERYHDGECAKKWAGFGAYTGKKVTSGTVVAMARERGWQPRSGHAFSLTDAFVTSDGPIDQGWIEDTDVEQLEPHGEWKPVTMLKTYIKALFQGEDYVDIVMNSVNGHPRDGGFSMTANGLLDRLEGQPDTDAGIRMALGDYDASDGAWVRINPMDGKGHGNVNVTEYRYALVESDEVDVKKQYGMIREMRLPCAAVVWSGGKSVHAVVRVDAVDIAEYQRRVDQLYRYCDSKGFTVDRQNKNPSRLSRLVGVMRGNNHQTLLGTSEGCADWEDWCAWVEESEDDLPADTNSDWDDPIVLAPPLIGTEGDGILRQGQKMVLAAPSKVGKSYAIIDLAEAIACGGDWWGYRCAKGPVFYVNLEIADMSFRMRQHAVWNDRVEHCNTGDGIEAMKENFWRWDLRGHACDMAKLTPLLIRRVLRHGPKGTFMAVVVDPIYKVNGGDENDAQAISDFTNQLDLIAEECGCAVIYVHHHAKGNLGFKSSVDRMSGSGVFARDADAILDLSPLSLSEEQQAQVGGRPAYRLECTLREFPTPKPKNLVFKFPRFYPVDGLEGAMPAGADPRTEYNNTQKRASAGRHEAEVANLRRALTQCRAEGVPPTRGNVLFAYNAIFGDGSMTATKLKAMTKPNGKYADWCPFRVAGADGNYEMYDSEIEEEPRYD